MTRDLVVLIIVRIIVVLMYETVSQKNATIMTWPLPAATVHIKIGGTFEIGVGRSAPPSPRVH